MIIPKEIKEKYNSIPGKYPEKQEMISQFKIEFNLKYQSLWSYLTGKPVRPRIARWLIDETNKVYECYQSEMTDLNP